MTRCAIRLLGVTVLLTAGCAPTGQTPTGADAARVAGVWAGTFTVGTTSGPIELTLSQQGSQVSGTASAAGYRGKALRGAVEARVEGATLSGAILVPGDSVGFNGRVDGNRIYGTLAGGAMELRHESYLYRSFGPFLERRASESP